jgi:hypothetical protein
MTGSDFDEIAKALKQIKQEEYLNPELHERVVKTVMGACMRRYKGSYGFNKEKFLKASGVE